MITQIGIVAGDIWQRLDQSGSLTLEQLIKELGVSQEVILMSLGWLAREGHIILSSQDAGFEASLVTQSI